MTQRMKVSDQLSTPPVGESHFGKLKLYKKFLSFKLKCSPIKDQSQCHLDSSLFGAVFSALKPLILNQKNQANIKDTLFVTQNGLKHLR